MRRRNENLDRRQGAGSKLSRYDTGGDELVSTSIADEAGERR